MRGRGQRLRKIRRWSRRLYVSARVAASGYGRHASSQFAAAIAYRVLFSVVPFVALLLSILDLTLPADARQDFVDWLFGMLPGNEIEASVDRQLRSAGVSTSVVGLIALATLLWAASGMMSSLRAAFRLIWGAEKGEPFVRGKLLDFALVLGTGLLLLAASVLSVVMQVVVAVGEDLAEVIGWHGEGQVLAGATEIGSSLALTFLAILLLYRILAPVPVRVAELWPAAFLAAIGIQTAVTGFGFYLAHFSSYSAVYGSLGAVLGFLLLVYVIAAVLLFGAEIAAAWPPTRAAEPAGSVVAK